MIKRTRIPAMPPSVRDADGDCRATLERLTRTVARGRYTLRVPGVGGAWRKMAGAHFHHAPEFFLQMAGETGFAFPEERLTLRTGEMCLLPSGLPHREDKRDGTERFRRLVIGFHSTSELWTHIVVLDAQRRWQPISVATCHGPAVHRIAGYFSDILAVEAPSCSLSVRGLLTATLAMVVEELGSRREPERDENVKVARCRQIVMTNLADSTLSVKTLALAIGCAPDYLSNLFSRQTGQRLTRYIDERRLSMARDLLLTSSRTIKEIAWACGYDDAGYFIRRFRLSNGIPPAAYRKARRLR